MNEFINKVFNMDNLKLMQEIPNDSIDLIYCDILYGTGKDFGNYKDIKANKEDVEDFYIPRIKEMHRILKNTGSVYLQMDWRISHWIRLILDDIFGYNNFQNDIVWCYKSGGATKKRWNRKHDNILFYSKSPKFIFNPQLEKSYNRGLKPYRFKGVEEFEDDIGWYTLVGAKDYWNIDMLGRTSPDRTGYATQKPKELMEKIIKASSNPGDIVADFFCGSGTTPVVARELGRRYIACDIEEEATIITRDRLNKLE